MAERAKMIYLEEIEAITPCTEEETTALLYACQHGSEDALSRFVEGNLFRVSQILDEMTLSEEVYMDAVQEGNLALMSAVSDPELSITDQIGPALDRLIRHAIDSFLKSEDESEKAADELAARLNVIDVVCESIAAETGREATAEEVAEKMKMDVEDVKYLMRIALAAIKKD